MKFLKTTPRMTSAQSAGGRRPCGFSSTPRTRKNTPPGITMGTHATHLLTSSPLNRCSNVQIRGKSRAAKDKSNKSATVSLFIMIISSERRGSIYFYYKK